MEQRSEPGLGRKVYEWAVTILVMAAVTTVFYTLTGCGDGQYEIPPNPESERGKRHIENKRIEAQNETVS